MVTWFDEWKEAVNRVIFKRLIHGAKKENIINWLKHLKDETFKDSDTVKNYLIGLINKMEA